MSLEAKGMYIYYSDKKMRKRIVRNLRLLIIGTLLCVISLGITIGYISGRSSMRRENNRDWYAFVNSEHYQQFTFFKNFSEQEYRTNYIQNIYNDASTFDFEAVGRRIGLSETEQLFFHYFAERYTTHFGLDIQIPYLFALMESDFHLGAYNRLFGATGIFQVTQICLDEYNKQNNTHLILRDMFDMENSFIVSMWYIRHLIDNYNINPTFWELYAAYCGGPNFNGNFSNNVYRRFDEVYRSTTIAFNNR